MRKFSQLGLLILCMSFLFQNVFSQNYEVIYLDLGDSGSKSTGNWNNLTATIEGEGITNLINSDGESTGVDVTVSDAFSGINTNGLDADESLNFPSSASGDSFFGRDKDGVSTLEPTGGVTLSNLNIDTEYTFTIFGSRSATDIRSTKYSAKGSTTDEASINCASNTNNVAIITKIKPAADGTIVITASPGDDNNNSAGYYYMGIVKISSGEGNIEPVSDNPIYLDFGSSFKSTSGNWNNITGPKDGAVENLIDTNGEATGIHVVVTDPFSDINEKGLSADASLNIPLSASGDSFFGRDKDGVADLQPTGGITFSNLEVNTAYTFTIFGSRDATDNRSTKYVVEGSTTDEASINCAGNSSDVAVISNIKPKADGTLSITASPGADNNNASGYYYMGVLKMTQGTEETPEVKNIDIIYPNGGEIWEIGKSATIKWNSKNITDVNIEYSTDEGNTYKTIASNATGTTYNWAIPSDISTNCKVKISDANNDTINDVSNAVFSITEDDGMDFHIVVLGSSTAAGTGPTTKDSAWVWMYREHLNNKYTGFKVTNLAVGGFTTYRLLPTGYDIPSSVNQTVAINNNITKALSLNPDAIIINLPSNDAAKGFPVEDQLENYDTIASLAAEANVPLWVCTPQPRTLDSSKDQIQLDMVDATFDIFGDKAIDFWDGFHNASYDILPVYNKDNVHMNNAGHKVLVARVIEAEIDIYIINAHTNYLKATLENNDLTELGSTTFINISSDQEWTIASDATWLKFSKTNGEGSEAIEVEVTEENTGSSERTADISVSAKLAEDIIITLNQLPKKYILTVNEGTGSGEFLNGEAVEIVAVAPLEGVEFAGWSGDTDFVQDKNLKSTTVTMPNKNITLTANYNNISTAMNNFSEKSKIGYYSIENTLYLSNIIIYNHIEVYSLQGQKLYTQKNNSGNLVIDLSHIQNGVYVLQLLGPNNAKAIKFVFN